MKIPKTICIKCEHVIIKENNGIWYNYFCRSTEKEKAVDPVTGISGFTEKNDLGGNCISEEEYYYCRDINNGNCEKFNEKSLNLFKWKKKGK